MERICPNCAAEVTEDQSDYCKMCGTRLLSNYSKSASKDRSFNYSLIFYLVILSDLIILFLFLRLTTSMYNDVTSKGYHNIGNIIPFLIIWIMNILLDVILMINTRKTPRHININLCWLKAIFGIIGFISIISGLYFTIISYQMNSVYNRERRERLKKDTEFREKIAELKRLNQDMRCENLEINTIGIGSNPELKLEKNVAWDKNQQNEQNNRDSNEARVGVYSLELKGKEKERIEENERIKKEREEYNRLQHEQILHEREESERRRQQEREEKERRKQEAYQKAEENIKKLEESNNLYLIDNYVKLYPDHLFGTCEFRNLLDLLRTKNFDFTPDELELIVRAQNGHLIILDFQKKLFQRNPKTSDDALKQYVEIFGRDADLQYTSTILPYFLKESFGYSGNIADDISRIRREMELKKFESNLIDGNSEGCRKTIADIDRLSGYEFETLLEKLFKKMGYQVIHTSLSKDQGADLIVEKFGEKTVIQAKNWENNVTNSGIQEVVASIKHYQAHKALVISSSGFTSNAIDLARSNNVELWDRQKLRQLLDEYPIFLQN